LTAKERRTAAKASTLPHPSREMQLPILKRIAELLKRRKAVAIEATGKKGMGILEELMEEHIKQFPWLTRNMVNHYTITYLKEYILPMIIDTQHQTVVSGIAGSSSVSETPTAPHIATVSETPTEPHSTTPNAYETTTTRVGHPKGTIHKSRLAFKDLVREAMDECTV
jgi:hypothetical protein